MTKQPPSVLLPVTTEIDADKCTGCGFCVDVCPMHTISLVNGKASITGIRSLNCGHCVAVFPEGAITVAALEPWMSELSGFRANGEWPANGHHDSVGLVRLIASRRSCRRYLDMPVERSLLEDLAKIGAMAPSATNRQAWAFTILAERREITPLVDPICVFYERLNHLVNKRWFRLAMKMMRRHAIDFYYRAYLAYLEEKIRLWRHGGLDAFFYRAPCAMIVSSKPGAILAKEDALLATQNILLAAHSMGLGTCLLGLVAGAMQKKPRIARKAGVPAEESVHTVIALGYPDQVFVRATGRKMAEIRFINCNGSPGFRRLCAR